MKNDPSFKFVAAIILLGVIVALASPNHASDHAHPAAADTPPAHATE